MANEPSPLIPLLMVIVLVSVIRGRSLLNTVGLVSVAEQAIFNPVVLIPLLVLLLVCFFSESFIVPLALALPTYMISKILLGPLILILIIYISVMCLRCRGPRGNGTDMYHERGGNMSRQEWGWGCILLLLISLILYGCFYEGETYEWGLTVLSVLLIMYGFFLF